MCVRERERERQTRLSGEIKPQAGRESILSSQSCRVAVENRGSELREKKKKPAVSLSLSEWLEGEPGWCDLVHHGMQPLYPAEARRAL